MRFPEIKPLRVSCFYLLVLLVASLPIVQASGQNNMVESQDEIRSVVVLVRHGVRAPIESEIRASAYNAQSWPSWPSEPGVLTQHGTQALHLLGEYYRQRYSSLLQHNSCENSGIYAESTSTQRTIASAKALLAILAPGCLIEVHSRYPGQRSPFFSAASNSLVDHQKLMDATNGRMANQSDWFTNAFVVPLAKMHHVLADCDGKDCDKGKPDFRTVMVKNGVVSERSARIESPVTLGADFAENFLLQYTEGMPMEQIGWGRVSRDDLNQLMEMNTRYHDFMGRTPYQTQVGASNLAAHIRDTLLSAAVGHTLPNALGTPQDHFVLLDAHDGNVASLGGLLRLDWLMLDQTFNATPPGGGLVFELHHNRTTGSNSVQVFFISQTLDQMRYLRPLTGSEQPSVSPIFVPGCSGTTPAYACSIEDFDKVVSATIDERFVDSPTK